MVCCCLRKFGMRCRNSVNVDQFFLIGGHKTSNIVVQPRVLLPQALFPFSERICRTRCLHTAIDFALDQHRVVQQPDNFSPHEFI